jgi:hypothetical protein
MLTIFFTPRRSSIRGTAAWQQWKAAEKLSRICASNSARRDVGKLGHEAGAGVVDQRVDAAVIARDPVEGRAHGPGLAQIDGDGLHRADPRGVLKPRRVDVEAHDPQPVARKPCGDRPPQTAGGACNDGDARRAHDGPVDTGPNGPSRTPARNRR